MNTEFAAVGSLRLRIVDQIVGNIVDVQLNFSDILGLQGMSLAQLLNGVKCGMGVLAAGVGLGKELMSIFSLSVLMLSVSFSKCGSLTMARQKPFSPSKISLAAVKPFCDR